MIKIVLVNNFQENRINQLIQRVFSKNFPTEILVTHINNLKNVILGNNNLYVIYNSDDDSINKIIKEIDCQKIDFGFNDEADFKVSDANITNDAINFKLNFKGNSVPIWLKNDSHTNNADEIYNFLSIICAGNLLGLNIIEISESLNG